MPDTNTAVETAEVKAPEATIPVPAPEVINHHKFAPNADQLALMVDHYTKTCKLPTNYVQCTKSGRQITMFGTNLEGRIAKFGSLTALLTTFICKDQIKADKLMGIIHADQPKSNSGFGVKAPVTKESLAAKIQALQAQLAVIDAAPAPAPVIAPIETPAIEIEAEVVPVETEDEPSTDEPVMTDEQLMAEMEEAGR